MVFLISSCLPFFSFMTLISKPTRQFEKAISGGSFGSKQSFLKLTQAILRPHKQPISISSTNSTEGICLALLSEQHHKIVQGTAHTDRDIYNKCSNL